MPGPDNLPKMPMWPWEKDGKEYVPETWDSKKHEQFVGRVLSHDQVAELRPVNTQTYRDLIATIDKLNGGPY